MTTKIRIVLFLFTILLATISVHAISARYILSLGNIPGKEGALKDPVAVTFGVDGNIFITDALRNSVLKYSPDGRFMGEIGGAGTGDGQFDAPYGISRRIGFGLFVCDSHNRRLVQINEDLSVVSSFSLNNITKDNTFMPFAIASSHDGTLFTTDPGDGEVLVLKNDNRIYPLPYKEGSQPTGIIFPHSIAVLSNIYMDDARSGHIYSFDKFGTFMRKFGENLSIPFCGLAACNDTILCAADGNKKQIILFSESGIETGRFSTFDANGEFAPEGIASQGRVFVVLRKDPPAAIVMHVRY